MIAVGEQSWERGPQRVNLIKTPRLKSTVKLRGLRPKVGLGDRMAKMTSALPVAKRLAPRNMSDAGKHWPRYST